MTARTWFITGTSSGIGRHLTEALLGRGDRVAATARNPGTLTDLAARYGDRLWAAALDVTDTPAIRRVVSEAFADLGRIDVIVSNAGYGLFGAAEEITDEQLTRQIDTNLIGSIQLARTVIPRLRAQGGGRLIQVSSMGGQVVFPGLGLYHATKWGVEGFFEAVAAELAPFGIGVTLVEPGAVRTDFGFRSLDAATPLPAYESTPTGELRRSWESFRPLGDPAKVAQAIIDSVEAPQAPRRLALGSDAYEGIRAGLRSRLADLEAQRDVAHATDADETVALRS